MILSIKSFGTLEKFKLQNDEFLQVDARFGSSFVQCIHNGV